jgi:hypothetical protein
LLLAPSWRRSAVPRLARHGGVIGALIGMGIPAFQAKRYDAKIREGNIVISVHTEDSTQRDAAKDVFKRFDADDISTGSEASVKKSA